MVYRAAIFDMDGTILDTLEDLRDGVNASLAWAGFPPRSLDEIRRFVGNGAAKLIERSVPAGTAEAATRRVLEYYRPYYEAHSRIKTGPYPGMTAALESLRGRGVMLAVVSNKPDGATKKLAAHYFPELFHVAIGARDGVAVKPAPDTLLEAMALLGVSPEETIYIGDSDVDIQTAKNAGVDCASVAWGFRSEEFLREHGAYRILRQPAELLTMEK